MSGIIQGLCSFSLFLLTLILAEPALYAGSTRSYRSAAADFKRRDPVAEANENFRKGEIYIFSAMGFGKYYPGVEDGRLAASIEKKYGERPIGRTSDVIESKAHLAYIQAATQFASAYNRQTVKLLGQKARH